VDVMSGGGSKFDVVVMFRGKLLCVVWVAGNWVLRYCSSSVSGVMSRRRPRKV
jgi:hypothetical protein